MHLIFRQKSETLGTTQDVFAVSVPQVDKEENDVDLDQIFLEFSENRTDLMEKYNELNKQSIEISKEKKELLLELKRQFKEDFLPEFEDENPEYFL